MSTVRKCCHFLGYYHIPIESLYQQGILFSANKVENLYIFEKKACLKANHNNNLTLWWKTLSCGVNRGLILFFLKNSFSFLEIFIFAILLLCIFDLNLINYFLDTEFRYTIQLESGTLFNLGPVHYCWMAVGLVTFTSKWQKIISMKYYTRDYSMYRLLLGNIFHMKQFVSTSQLSALQPFASSIVSANSLKNLLAVDGNGPRTD